MSTKQIHRLRTHRHAREGAVVRADTVPPPATFNMVFKSVAASAVPPASAAPAASAARAPAADADAALDAGAAPISEPICSEKYLKMSKF